MQQPIVTELVIATHNSAKYNTLVDLLRSYGITIPLYSLAEKGITQDIEETGTTIEENALLKATYYARLTGLVCLSDDSSLAIEALGGAPGIHAKRFAGPNATEDEKRQALLDALKGAPASKRTATFSSAIALAWPDGTHILTVGSLVGTISEDARGTHIPQFPYCSIFIEPRSGKTIAELVDQGIALASEHRHKALQQLLTQVQFQNPQHAHTDK